MISRKWSAGIFLTVATTLIVTTDAIARPEYVVPTGASNCDSCHLDNFGTGYKDGVLQAAASPLGKIPGLTAFLHPAPIVTGSDTKPVFHPINDQWDVTVGEAALFIPLRVSDAEDDNFAVQGTVPLGMSVAKSATDVQSHFPMASLGWRPVASQANQTYTISLSAKETGAGRTLVSDTMTTKVKVWPARTSVTKNVSQFILQQAQWNNHQLVLTGKVVFKKITAVQRKAALASLQMNIRTENGAVVSAPLTLTADASGNWTSAVTLTDSQVPCVVKLDYEGLNALRTVKLAPTASCVK